MTRCASRRVPILATSLALLLGFAPPSSAVVVRGLVANGNFETGDHTGWGISDRGSGTWKVYEHRQDIQPPVISPPVDEFAIASRQGGPGSHILHQVVRLPESGQHRLKFNLWYRSNAPITTPDSLSHEVKPNQQFRMDILKPRVALRTMDPADILATAFRTSSGDPRMLDLCTISLDLSSLAGRLVRLRFAEVDNQGFFNVVIDWVRIVRYGP
jgi:hypothetical protein